MLVSLAGGCCADGHEVTEFLNLRQQKGAFIFGFPVGSPAQDKQPPRVLILMC